MKSRVEGLSARSTCPFPEYETIMTHIMRHKASWIVENASVDGARAALAMKIGELTKGRVKQHISIR